MSKPHADIRAVLHGLAAIAVKSDRRETLDVNFDGSAISAPDDLAAAMGITYSEASLRLQAKDIYSAMDAQAVTIGLHGGDMTGRQRIIQRARAVALSKRTPNKKARTKTSKGTT